MDNLIEKAKSLRPAEWMQIEEMIKQTSDADVKSELKKIMVKKYHQSEGRYI